MCVATVVYFLSIESSMLFVVVYSVEYEVLDEVVIVSDMSQDVAKRSCLLGYSWDWNVVLMATIVGYGYDKVVAWVGREDIRCMNTTVFETISA